MGFFKSLGRRLGKVAKGAGKFAVNAGGKIIKVGGKVGGKVLSKFEKIADKGIAGAGNITGLLSPSNLMLYAGIGIVAIITLPKILDSGAAKNVSAGAVEVAKARAGA